MGTECLYKTSQTGYLSYPVSVVAAAAGLLSVPASTLKNHNIHTWIDTGKSCSMGPSCLLWGFLCSHSDVVRRSTGKLAQYILVPNTKDKMVLPSFPVQNDRQLNLILTLAVGEHPPLDLRAAG